MDNIKKKENLLNLDFIKRAKRFRNDLLACMKDKKKRESIYSDFLDMLLSAQKEEKSFEEIIPDYEVFLSSCIGNEKQRAKIVRPVIKHRRPIVITSTSILSAVLLIFVYLLSFGYIGVWTKGIEYMDTSNRYVHTSHTITDEIEFQFRIRTHWALGQEIYDDGINQIVAERGRETVIYDAERTNIVGLTWVISLKCIGTVKNGFGQIVCGKDFGDEKQNAGGSFTYELDGITYTGGTYTHPFADFKNSTVTEIRISAYLEDNISTEEDALRLEAMKNTEIINIKISGLILNQWVKK